MTAPDAVERAQFAAELGFAEAALGGSYDTELVEPDDPGVLPLLVVHLGADEEGRPRTMRLSFVPTGDDVEHCKFLQMDVPLPYSARPAALGEVRQAVAIVNEALAAGRFGVRDDGSLYFRYVHTAPKHEMIDDDLLGELVAFVEFQQENFGDYVEGVCDGEISIAVLPEVIRRAG